MEISPEDIAVFGADLLCVAYVPYRWYFTESPESYGTDDSKAVSECQLPAFTDLLLQSLRNLLLLWLTFPLR